MTCRVGCACFFTEACLETRLRGATCFGKLSSDDLADENFCTVYFLFSGCNQACFGGFEVPDVARSDSPFTEKSLKIKRGHVHRKNA